jgi:type II secretory pathway pseudopilin PulG
LARSRCTDESGFSIVEVLVATLVLSVGLLSVAQLFAVSTKGNTAARSNTFTVMLAQQKMEQLRSLTWGFDTVGLPVSDYNTDTTNVGTLAGCTSSGTGAGTGLSPSPSGTLTQNTDGWVDYLDQNGCDLGGGGNAPNGTTYIRRWSVEPLPTNPNNTLILQVLVTRRTNRGNADAGNVARLPEETRLMSVKTRKSK